MNLSNRHPRGQAERLAGLVSREGANFRGVVLGKRREGKTDLLEQVRAQLFARAEGPVPFLYAWGDVVRDASGGAFSDALGGRRDEAAQARRCFASFCQQVRAFLMRQEDLLGEPVALLERELERPGLPLSLTELAQDFLALPAEHQTTFVSRLPGQWAYLERRPVCWLLDEAHELDHRSPIFAGLASSRFSWLLSGRCPQLRRQASEAGWPITPLEPLSLTEMLTLADRECRAAGLPFAGEAWEAWLGVTEVSPWLIHTVVEAAAVHGTTPKSLEDLGRLYIQELTGGGLGNWLAGRFERALPDGRDRVLVARFLEGLARTGLAASTPALPSRMWDGLVAEEWAVETPLGPRLHLDPVQWDWLWLAAASKTEPASRAQARGLQPLLLRAEQRQERRMGADLSASIRQRLLELPQRGFPPGFEWTVETLELPDVCSVSLEQGGGRSGTAQLFWCYGFQGGRRDTPEAACVLLIALCEVEPTLVEIGAWKHDLESEERLLPANPPDRALPGRSRGPRRELWLVLPTSASLQTAGSERRFSLETFAQWLEAGAASENRH